MVTALPEMHLGQVQFYLSCHAASLYDITVIQLMGINCLFFQKLQ